jgi:Thioesterase-like superfamily
MDDARALYLPDGDGFVATRHTQGAWNPEHQHGGPVQALMARAVENTPSLVPMQVVRLTHDLFRANPIGVHLDVTTEIVREGKRIQLVDAVLRVAGVEHVRTRALRLRIEDASDLADLPSPPADGLDVPWAEDILPMSRSLPRGMSRPGFLEGIELRHIGPPVTPGPVAGLWVRLRGPVVAGEEPTPLQRLSVTADFTNLVGTRLDPQTISAINPDLSVHVLRLPVGPWVAAVGETRISTTAGVGVSAAQIRDRDGICALASNCQLVSRR